MNNSSLHVLVGITHNILDIASARVFVETEDISAGKAIAVTFDFVTHVVVPVVIVSPALFAEAISLGVGVLLDIVF